MIHNESSSGGLGGSVHHLHGAQKFWRLIAVEDSGN